jgi:hypothetical protein
VRRFLRTGLSAKFFLIDHSSSSLTVHVESSASKFLSARRSIASPRYCVPGAALWMSTLILDIPLENLEEVGALYCSYVVLNILTYWHTGLRRCSVVFCIRWAYDFVSIGSRRAGAWPPQPCVWDRLHADRFN